MRKNQPEIVVDELTHRHLAAPPRKIEMMKSRKVIDDLTIYDIRFYCNPDILRTNSK